METSSTLTRWIALAWGEQALLTGQNTPFGVSVALSWIGSSGFLAVEEAINGFEVLRFNTALAQAILCPRWRGRRYTVLLNVDGGGGAGLTKISRDGSMALIRNSTSGSGGVVSIRAGAVSSMVAQASSTFGTLLISTNAGADGPYANGGALSPNGSQLVLSVPLTTSTSAHDLKIGNTSGGSMINLTNNAVDGFFDVFPDISPDGTKIVFARKSPSSTDYNLFVMNIDGSGLIQLTDTPNFAESNPSWSPDGKSVAFNGVHTAGHENEAPALAPGESANYNIYILGLPQPAATPTPSATSTPVPGIVTPNTKLSSPPAIVVENRKVTFRFTSFSGATLENILREARAQRAKVSFQYDSVISPDKKLHRDEIRKTSKKDSVTINNLPYGKYTAKYRVTIISKAKGKPSSVKSTKYSPSGKFQIVK